jgi:hypothetical protein
MLSAPALADMTKDECIDANGKGQQLRRDGAFSAARVQLRQCATASCPVMVRDDCTRRLDELEKAQPTVVFEVKDSAGADLIDVRVSIDGQLLVSRLSGKPVNVDPGAHELTFEASGKPPLHEKLLISEGETRRERVVLGAAAAPSAAPASSSVTPPPPLSPAEPAEVPSSGWWTTRRVIGISIAGAGAVGVGVGAVFGLLASSSWSQAKSACGGDPTRCTDVTKGNSYRDTTLTDGTISTIGLIGGGALIAAGIVVLVTAPHAESHPAMGVIVAPSVAPGIATVDVEGAF